MTRTTGATDEQITAAEELLNRFMGKNPLSQVYGENGNRDNWGPHDGEYLVALVGPALVPPDQRIVAVADLRSVMELAMTSAWAADNYEIIDRITALIGDEA